MLDEHSRPRLNEGITLLNPEGSGLFFAFRSSTGERFELNEVSFEIIQRLDGETSVHDIALWIESEFDGATDAKEDVLALVSGLISEELVTLNP